jgi:hypothetical protein
MHSDQLTVYCFLPRFWRELRLVKFDLTVHDPKRRVNHGLPSASNRHLGFDFEA